MIGYGVTLSVGLGVPIPVLDDEIARFTAVRDADIQTQVVDYSRAYPEGIAETIGTVNYAELRKGSVTIAGRKVQTGGLSSYAAARKIACTLKAWIQEGAFLLTEPVQPLPDADSGYTVKPMNTRELSVERS